MGFFFYFFIFWGGWGGLTELLVFRNEPCSMQLVTQRTWFQPGQYTAFQKHCPYTRQNYVSKTRFLKQGRVFNSDVYKVQKLKQFADLKLINSRFFTLKNVSDILQTIMSSPQDYSE